MGRDLLAYLTANGMPTAAHRVTREHLETYLADMLTRVAPATVAKHYRSLQQLWRCERPVEWWGLGVSGAAPSA